MRIAVLALIALTACDLDPSAQSQAVTAPGTNAEAKPAALGISPPWRPGVSHRITQGYGTGKHTQYWNGLNDTNALDFDMTLGEPVYPVADGIVLYAGAAGGNYASYGTIAFIEHVRDGERYQSLYAHLSQLYVAAGDEVTTAMAIGAAGKSSSDPTTPVHLHFSLHHDAGMYWAGPYPRGGGAVVPEPFDDCEKNGGEACTNLKTNDVLARADLAPGCGTACERCVLEDARPDILPFYRANGWNTSCADYGAILTNWCQIDPTGCATVRSTVCADACGGTPPEQPSCASSCTQCILTQRDDILPFYQRNDWDISCGNQDAIIADWCAIDPAGCDGLRTGACSGVCTPYSGCGSHCTECILVQRPDILPFYGGYGWDTSCENRDAITHDWCRIDPAGCDGLVRNACFSVCGGVHP